MLPAASLAATLPPVRLAAGAPATAPSSPPAPAQPAREEPAPPPTAGALTLQAALAAAMAANPELAAARAARPVSEAAINQALERPNPDLVLEASKETPKQSATFTLPVELAGKRGKRADVARAALRSGEGEIATAEADVRARVRRAFYELIAARRSESELQQAAALAGRLREAARARFESGEAPRLELLEAGLAADQADTEALVASGATASAAAALNALLGRPPAAPVEPLGDLDAGEAPEPDPAVEVALGASTELTLLDARIAEARARIELAKAQRVPDPSFDVAATHDSEPDFTWGWRAGVALTLPVFTRHQAAVVIEERSFDRATAEREAAASRIRADVFAAASLARAQRDRSRRYRDAILPQAVEIEGMAEEAYRAGETGLVAMLQSFQTTRQIRRDAIQAGLDYQSALAELERAMGTPLP